MNPIRIVIAEDSPVFRKGIIDTFAEYKNKNCKAVGQACNGKELMAILARTHCDIVLLDLKMPVLDGGQAIPLILEKHPNIKIIVFTMVDEEYYILQLIRSGIHGYLLKDAQPEVIIQAIETVMREGFYFDEKITKLMRQSLVNKRKAEISLSPRMHFSERDLEVLKLLCQDYSTDEIADKLNLSVRSIEYYRSQLLMKTGAKNITGVVAYAFKNHLVDL